MAMPMLVPITTWWPSMSRGSLTTSMMRWASSVAAAGCVRPHCRMANSSPPMRAIVSVLRTTVRKRSAIWRSSLSPAGWPSVSLMVLKSSRSSRWQAATSPGRMRARASSSLSFMSTRLGRSVSASWWAMWAMRASRRRCSVMSSCVVTQPPPGIGRRATAIERPSLSSWMVLDGSSTGSDVVAGVLLGLAIRIEAVADAQLNDLLQTGARLHLIHGEAVHLRVARIAGHDLLLGVEHAQALRHGLERRVEDQVLRLQRLFLIAQATVLIAEARVEALVLGDVLAGRHPAALLAGADGDRDGAAVRQLAQEVADSLAGDMPPHLVHDVGDGQVDVQALGDAVLDDRLQAGAGFQLARVSSRTARPTGHWRTPGARRRRTWPGPGACWSGPCRG